MKPPRTGGTQPLPGRGRLAPDRGTFGLKWAVHLRAWQPLSVGEPAASGPAVVPEHASCDALVATPGLLDTLLARTARRMGTTSISVRAAQLVDRHARVVAEALAPAIVVGRRAALAPGDVVIDLAPDGELTRAHLGRGENGAQRPESAAAEFAELHAPLVLAVAARRGRAEAVLFRSVGDRLAIAVAAEARARGRDADVPGLVAAMIGADARFGPARRLGVARIGATTRPYLVRAGCCLSHRTVKDRPCFTCPVLRDEERVARLAEELAGS